MNISIEKVKQVDGTFKFQIFDSTAVEQRLQFNTWQAVVNYLTDRVGEQEI